ncbi:MAG: Lrp/AsnC family transcriptional regulator, partial [Clostridiales bacterium]|nr:Lrp/AsnC family transcriptional regulator [Clostridiales bacterium]
KKLALFVAQKLSTIDGVLSTATHFVLKRYKSEGVILDEKSEDRRLKVSP